MKLATCITYGWLVVLTILLSIIASVVGLISASAAMGISIIGGLGLLIWWLLGFFTDCGSYYGKVMQNPEYKRSYGEQ